MERNYERKLDLWQYQMPYESMTKKDMKKANEYGVLIQRDYLNDGDFIIGTWNNIEYFMIGWLGYEMNMDWMNPLYVGTK